MKIVAAVSFALAAFVLALPACAQQIGFPASTEEMLQSYLAMPGTARIGGSDQAEFRMARLRALDTLGHCSNVVATVRSTLPFITNAWRRAELAEMLGRRVQTADAAALLVEMGRDSNPEVRGEALHGLRLLASRIDRSGRRGIQAEPAHPPKVEGLLPHLLAAADDPSPAMRGSALYALADTREPQAMEKVRKLLLDPDAGIRLNAACLLTEIHDASGIEEMKKALRQLREQTDLQFYFQAENLMLAFERITGKSFGAVPLNPTLSSSGGQENAREYRALVDAWIAWWDWTPK